MATVNIRGSLAAGGDFSPRCRAQWKLLGILDADGRLSNELVNSTSSLTLMNIDYPQAASDIASVFRVGTPHRAYNVIVGVNAFGAIQSHTAYRKDMLPPQRLERVLDTISSGTLNYYA